MDLKETFTQKCYKFNNIHVDVYFKDDKLNNINLKTTSGDLVHFSTKVELSNYVDSLIRISDSNIFNIN